MEIPDHPPLPPERQLELYHLAKSGNPDAYDTLTLSLAGMVIDEANKHDSRLSFEDLVQEGFSGVARAFNRFDPERGVAFSTYSYYWIRQAIRRAVHDDRMIHIPENQSERVGELFRMLHLMRQELGREPTKDEINERAAELGIVPTSNFTPFQLMLRSMHPDSFNRPVSDDGTELGAFIPCEDEDVEHKVDCNILSDKVLEVMRQELDEKERDVITSKLRYQRDYEIAKRWGCSREWVRLVKHRAYNKMREPLKELGYGAV